MTTYIIIERKGHRPDGIVPHDVEIDGQIVETNIDYLQARQFVKNHTVQPDDVVIERYESTGTEVKAIGRMLD